MATVSSGTKIKRHQLTFTLVINSQALLADLQKEVTKLHTDLRARCDAEPSVDSILKAQYDAARAGQRTALTYKAWREEELTNVAVAWVLACVFIRFLEDNALVETLYLAGPDAAGIARARDQHIVYFRESPGRKEREYLENAFSEISKLPGMADLFDRRHNSLWTVGPSDDATRAFIEFWRKADTSTGRPVHDFSDSKWGTRFLGDLYQDLSEAARRRYALLQTPAFIEQFILDRTLTPAIETFGFREVRMIDPTCGSGHFLLGGFARLHALWDEALPGEVPSVVAQHSLDQVFGVDLNPNVVAIARFRLLLAALRVTGTAKLRNAYDFKINVAAGDSLLHGRRFRDFESHTTNTQRTFDTEEIFRDELKHHYDVEDGETLHRILGQQYHAVVGNPPYITVKDKSVSELYRARYSSCSGKYSLSVPFMERFFDLAIKGDVVTRQPAGFVGQITSNSFMKREFGKKLIEEYLPCWDLTHVLDTAGAYIPGHGTPTVILLGKNQIPTSGTIRAVLGIRGEPATPSDPARGFVWQAILQQVDDPGSVSEWVSATDTPRDNFHKHPWSIGGGGVAELKEQLSETASERLGSFTASIGFMAIISEDDAFVGPCDYFRRRNLPHRSFVTGDSIRDWVRTTDQGVTFPYEETEVGLSPSRLCERPELAKSFWPNRAPLRMRKMFGKHPAELGLEWFEFIYLTSGRYLTEQLIAFASVGTHNHFVLIERGAVLNRHAPVIKLKSDIGPDDLNKLMGVLNSSAACFWMKQVFHNKGSTVDERGARQTTVPFENFYEFNGTQLESFPLPARKPQQLPTALVKFSKALQAHSPAVTLASWCGPVSGDLQECLASARAAWTDHRKKLIALQEELDWQNYEAFDLVAADDGVNLTEGEGMDMVYEFGLELGERAFEIVLARRVAAGEVESTWFERHNSTPITDLPSHWPTHYREMIERRIRLIEDDQSIRLIEQPEYKRRWNTEAWNKQFERAASEWLLARMEGYFCEGQRVCELKNGFKPAASGFVPAVRPALTTTNQLAEIAKTDLAFLAVAEQFRGGSGFSVPMLVHELVETAAVPFLPAQRHKPAGLRKRHDWEHVWELQREEDRIDALIAAIKAKIDARVEVRLRTEKPGLIEREAKLAKELDALDRAYHARFFQSSEYDPEYPHHASGSSPTAPDRQVEHVRLSRAKDAHRETEHELKRATMDIRYSDTEIDECERDLAAVPPKPQVPVPPKYTSGDFKKSVWWSLRGKLDVPKERWIYYPGAEGENDRSPVIAWAGWDHAQQASALAEYYLNGRDNWTASPDKDAKLQLLLAGLLDLLPWLRQWHGTLDPSIGDSPANAIRAFLDGECNRMEITANDLDALRVGG
jgi:hypothetical protein